MRKTSILVSLLVSSLFGHPDWGYDAKNGPSQWGKMSEEFLTCSLGRTQSPIDIHTNETQTMQDHLSFAYGNKTKDFVNNGHSVQVNFADHGGGMVTFNGVDYHLKQFHFHTPSENRINSQVYPVEMHLVHSDAKNNLLVVSVLFQEGEANKIFQKLLDVIPSKSNSSVALKKFEISSLLPSLRTHFSFMGSLTTPPCTESVQWIVMKEPIEASRQQIENLHKVLGHNARNVQSLNGRKIEISQ